MVKAEIRELGGVPTIYVNGVPKGPMTYTGVAVSGKYLGRDGKSKLKFEQLRRLGEVGIEIFFMMVGLADPEAIDITLRDLDGKMKRLLNVIPEAKVILRTSLSPYQSFAEKHPDGVLTFDDGSTAYYLANGYGWASHKDVPRYTYASEAWKAEAGDSLARLIRHVNNAPYNENVIGYFICAGTAGEWHYWADFDHSRYAVDYSPAMVGAFRKALIKKYQGDVHALRKAWGDEEVDFSTAQIPSKKERDRFDFGLFWDPDKSRKVLDYYRCHHEVVAEAILHFAKLVKKESSNNVLCGFFYGYLVPCRAVCRCRHYIEGGQSVFKDVLRAKEVSFIASPPPYENRGVGDHAPFKFITETLKHHGKLWMSEADTRTHTSGHENVRYGTTKTVEDAVEALKRDFAHILCRGANGWWFEMGWGWYEHPKILEAFSKMQRIGKLSLEYPRQMVTDIAVIVDQESILSCSHDVTHPIVGREKIHELPRIGSPCVYYELDDVLKGDVGSYKMYIFLNAFNLNAEERRLIDKKLKKNGNTLVWMYAPGIINPDAHPAIDLDHMRTLTGMRLNCVHGKHILRVNVSNYGDPITEELPKGTSFGDFDRPLTTGFLMQWGGRLDTMDEGWWLNKMYSPKLPPVASDPLFYVDDPEATILGAYVENRKPAFAVKRFSNWTSVYVGPLSVSSPILRAMAKAASAHLYDEEDDIVYANRHFLAIHTNRAGERTIKLRKRVDVYELFDEYLVGRNINAFKLKIPESTTRLFFLGDADEMKNKYMRIKTAT